MTRTQFLEESGGSWPYHCFGEGDQGLIEIELFCNEMGPSRSY